MIIIKVFLQQKSPPETKCMHAQTHTQAPEHIPYAIYNQLK